MVANSLNSWWMLKPGMMSVEVTSVPTIIFTPLSLSSLVVFWMIGQKASNEACAVAGIFSADALPYAAQTARRFLSTYFRLGSFWNSAS